MDGGEANRTVSRRQWLGLCGSAAALAGCVARSEETDRTGASNGQSADSFQTTDDSSTATSSSQDHEPLLEEALDHLARNDHWVQKLSTVHIDTVWRAENARLAVARMRENVDAAETALDEGEMALESGDSSDSRAYRRFENARAIANYHQELISHYETSINHEYFAARGNIYWERAQMEETLREYKNLREEMVDIGLHFESLTTAYAAIDKDMFDREALGYGDRMFDDVLGFYDSWEESEEVIDWILAIIPRLEGHATLQTGLERYERGRYDDALAAFNEAETKYRGTIDRLEQVNVEQLPSGDRATVRPRYDGEPGTVVVRDWPDATFYADTPETIEALRFHLDILDALRTAVEIARGRGPDAAESTYQEAKNNIWWL